MVEIFKILGDANILRILNLLVNDKLLCVCEIEIILELTHSNASSHLNRLKDIGIITPIEKDEGIHYKINDKFKEDNDLLFDFLYQKFKTNVIYLKDLNRYNKYKVHNLTCNTIEHDKNKVLNILK